MLVTEGGMMFWLFVSGVVNVYSLPQDANALFPMVFRPLGKTTFSRLLQPLNVLSPMDFASGCKVNSLIFA